MGAKATKYGVAKNSFTLVKKGEMFEAVEGKRMKTETYEEFRTLSCING